MLKRSLNFYLLNYVDYIKYKSVENKVEIKLNKIGSKILISSKLNI